MASVAAGEIEVFQALRIFEESHLGRLKRFLFLNLRQVLLGAVSVRGAKQDGPLRIGDERESCPREALRGPVPLLVVVVSVVDMLAFPPTWCARTIAAISSTATPGALFRLGVLIPAGSLIFGVLGLSAFRLAFRIGRSRDGNRDVSSASASAMASG